MITEAFRLAFRNLRYRKRRSWLTIIGTLIGILAVVSLISIGQGLENSVQREFERLGGNKVFVTPGGGISSRFSDTTVSLTDDDLSTLRNTRGVVEAAGQISESRRVRYKKETVFAPVNGLPLDFSGDLVKSFNNIEVRNGRYLRSTDRNNVVIGENLAEDRYDTEINLRSSINVAGENFRVVGVMESSGNQQIDNGMIMEMDTARELLGKQDSYDTLIAEVGEGFRPRDVADDIERDLRQERNVDEGDEDFNVQTSDDIIESFTNQLSIIRAVIVGIGAISLFVGGVGIMNTMYTSVTERTREIGIMKAVGATNRQILGIFLIESGFIGLVGGAMGATVGIAISYIATSLITEQIGLAINPYVSPELVLGALLFSFTVGMVSGILPARRAAKMDPVEALRYK